MKAFQQVRVAQGKDATPAGWDLGQPILTPGPELVGRVWEVCEVWQPSQRDDHILISINPSLQIQRSAYEVTGHSAPFNFRILSDIFLENHPATYFHYHLCKALRSELVIK